MSVTVYSKPACVQCTATYTKLDNLGINYDVIDISQDQEAREYVMSLGHLAAPVVIAGDDQWAGYNPDKIVKLAQRLAA
jgi:glutaredoxin-like protein NrdH